MARRYAANVCSGAYAEAPRWAMACFVIGEGPCANDPNEPDEPNGPNDPIAMTQRTIRQRTMRGILLSFDPRLESMV
jgi:hypothetical protein